MNRLTKKSVILTLLICGGLTVVQPFSVRADPLDPYIQAAKKEGAVQIGVTLRGKIQGKPSGTRYIAAFQKRYPFLKVGFKRIGGTRERERVLTEMTAGMYNFDVVTAGTTMLPTLISAKLLRVAPFEQLGVAKFLAHPQNIGVSLRTPVYGIAYNRDLIPDETARTFTWETCMDPKYKGKIAMDDGPRHLFPFFRDDVWGREKTLDYARRWAVNKPHVEHSRSTAAAKLASGALSMHCGMPRTQVLENQEYGDAKSIGIVFPEPVPVGVGDFIFVPEKSSHPNAGILFLAWTGTQEAQNLLDEVNFSGHPAFEGNDVNKVIKGKKVAYASWEDAALDDQYLTEILQAMGMPVVRAKKKK
ncbi:MAG: extracellular solute-binding protein [Desulfobacterales bacterium]|nr:extracellular solute-binding protein [Desulfobacterales bacterium]